jgi:hypothetical protein
MDPVATGEAAVAAPVAEASRSAGVEPEPGPEIEPEPGAEVVVEAGVPLSASVLWRLQRSFYEQRGIAAWSAGSVPSYVTCNPFIARAYARVILGFVRDCAARSGARPTRAPRTGPVHVVELGAGSGRFAFLLLRQLRALARALGPAWGGGDRPAFRYVMTDVADSNVRAWGDNPALRPFVAEGLLDFARFDAERDREVALLHAGTVLAPGAVAGPIVAIANYVFDTLSHDAWRVEGGALQAGLGTLVARQAGAPDLADPGLIDRLALRLAYVPAAEAPYGDPSLDRILAGYRSRLGDTTFLLPVGALRCLRTLADLLGEDGEDGEDGAARLLLLSADKGYCREEELLNRGDPTMALHGSCSFSVNYHAIGAYVRGRGGLALEAPAWDGTLAVAAYVLGARDEGAPGAPDAGAPEGFAETALAFGEAVAGFGPFHFYALAQSLAETSPFPTLAQVLALLRLSGWDPAVAMRYAPVLRAEAPAASPGEKRELVRALDRVWANHYPIGEDDDLPFELGTVVQALQRPAEAIAWYERSLGLFGDHQATHTNIGMCLYALGRLPEALAAFERALGCHDGHGPARDWRLRVGAELAAAATRDEALAPPARE